MKHTKLSRSRNTSTESSRTQESNVGGATHRASDPSVGSSNSRSRESSAAGGGTQTVSSSAVTQTSTGTGADAGTGSGSGSGSGVTDKTATEIVVTGASTARSKHKGTF